MKILSTEKRDGGHRQFSNHYIARFPRRVRDWLPYVPIKILSVRLQSWKNALMAISTRSTSQWYFGLVRSTDMGGWRQINDTAIDFRICLAKKRRKRFNSSSIRKAMTFRQRYWRFAEY